MKEIKLQFWNRKSKTMSVPYSLADLAYEGFPNQYKNEHEDVLDEECDVLQFTGLKDKNGKEIYEGDIVKIHNYKETWKRGEPKIDWRVFEIRWNRYLWSFNNSVISKPLADYDTTDLMPYDIEIIGNIYENPNLLQDSTKGVIV